MTNRVGARIEIAEPPPEPAAVLERVQLRGLRQPEARRRQLAEDVDVLDRIDAGHRGLRPPGRVLMHEDRQASGVSACASSAGGVGSHRDVELDTVHARVCQRVHLRLGAGRIEAPTEAGETRVHLAFLEHRSGEENSRAGPDSGLDRGAIRRDVVKLAAEVQHGRHARREEELRVPFLGRVDMDVHVHEPGDHELAPSVDEGGVGGNPCRRRRSEPDDSVPFDQDRRGFDGDPAGAVDHPGADHGESVDFSRARNISHVEGLSLGSVILPTGLSTAVHNLHAVQGGPRRRLGAVTDRGDLPDQPED